MDSWTRSTATPFRSTFGEFTLRAFEFSEGFEHAALVVGRLAEPAAPLVRLQSSCLTGTAFGAVLCDCRAQLEQSLARVCAEGRGVILYLDQEGRGHGLVEKVRQLARIAAGEANTATAAGEHTEPDRRSYEQAAVMLQEVSAGPRIRLMTNNPKKVAALEALGFDIDRVPVEVAPTPDNREYLRVKKELMGHLLTLV